MTRLGYGESDDESQTPTRTRAAADTNGRKRRTAKETKTEANGITANGKQKKEEANNNKKVTRSELEFGGELGVSSVMIGFPLLMYYMWIGATYYGGKFPRPAEGQSVGEFFSHLVHLVYEGAFPSIKAWTIYWGFLIFEAICYMYLPGVQVSGRRLPHMGGQQLSYYCSAMWSFYTSIGLALILHVTGLFKLYTLTDEFGPIMSVAIISGVGVSFVAYFSALARGAQHRMTGYPIYDFFMGAELNPRMFGILDFKMFFEVRIPWFILFFLSLGTATRQFEQYGYVSGEVAFLLMAHYLYANACSKAEECIVSTWYDIFYFYFYFFLSLEEE